LKILVKDYPEFNLNAKLEVALRKIEHGVAEPQILELLYGEVNPNLCLISMTKLGPPHGIVLCLDDCREPKRELWSTLEEQAFYPVIILNN
jgi:hypothetical protein